MRSKFITFEGGEGAGKTTLLDAIARQLSSQGHSVVKAREPGGTPLGEELRNLVLHAKREKLSPYAELCLFLASRAEQIFEVIRPSLEKGQIVLCDRFHDSSVAYQGVARGLGMEEVSQVCSFISEGLEPDLTLYLDLDPALGLARVKNGRAHDRIESEKLSFHRKIREGFLAIHKKEPDRFRLLDATKTPETVFQEAMKLVDTCLMQS